jgi:ATP-binding cassette subfamily B protein
VTGDLPFPSAVVLILSSFSLFSALELMGYFAAFFRLTQYSMDRINQVKEINKMDENPTFGTIEQFDIDYENLCFAYETKNVLQNISFSVPEKSMTALVGLSGSGKTTIVNLLARFWDIEEGAIRIGGKEIRSLPYEELLKNLSFVFQDVFLFDDTVLNNIRLGRPDASMDEVTQAARKAGCHGFICQMEKGYNSMIGEAGARLSGGEKQRISIARALIKDAPIVLLDEVTANVDAENEYSIQMALRELLKDRTVIMIAHKLSTIQSVDQILVIENGSICQKGNHRELVEQDGLYKRLWDRQYQTSRWKI